MFADHLGIVNDLASYDKELRAFESYKASDIINLVQVVKDVVGLEGTSDAKAVAFALQSQAEQGMVAEIEVLQRSGTLTTEEETFLRAILESAAGHVMFCMTTSRYGGEAARI